METDADIRGKAYVHWASWHDTYPGMVSREYLNAFTLEKCEKSAFLWRDGVLVARDMGRVIGFVGYGESRELPDCGEIYALYVLAEYRGRGVGSRLLQAGLEQLRTYSRVCLWALRDNKRAIRFYEARGFRVDGAEKLRETISAVGIRMVREGVKP